MAAELAPVPAELELPLAQPVQELEPGPALAAQERRLAVLAQQLELSPVELERELDLAEAGLELNPAVQELELRPVQREPSRVEAEPRLEVVVIA
jgi:hypothetical protein